IDAPAAIHIDRWIDFTVINVSGSNDIRTAKKHNTIGVRNCGGHMKQLNSLIVEEPIQVVLAPSVRVCWQRRVRVFPLAHPRQNLLVRKDINALLASLDLDGLEYRRGSNLRIPTYMVGI